VPVLSKGGEKCGERARNLSYSCAKGKRRKTQKPPPPPTPNNQKPQTHPPQTFVFCVVFLFGGGEKPTPKKKNKNPKFYHPNPPPGDGGRWACAIVLTHPERKREILFITPRKSKKGNVQDTRSFAPYKKEEKKEKGGMNYFRL